MQCLRSKVVLSFTLERHDYLMLSSLNYNANGYHNAGEKGEKGKREKREGEKEKKGKREKTLRKKELL